MVGGTVVEVADVPGESEILYVDVVDFPYSKPERCAIYVARTDVSELIQIGDALWWQGRLAMWTPQENRNTTGRRCGVDFDIQIPRVGYSGVRHPSRTGVNE